MKDLDAVTSEYFPDAATAKENDLVLRWYPRRIIQRFGYCESLLELGIGHGFTAPIFNQACDKHVIVEGSQVVIDLFQKNHPNFTGELVFGYFETFEPREPFDVIIMGFVLEHVDDPGLLLSRYKTFLKRSGKLFLTVPNAKSLNRRLGLEMGIIDDIYALNANDLALGHKRQFCRDRLREFVLDHGFRVLYEEGIYMKPLPISVLRNLPDFESNLLAMLKVGVDFPDLCVALLMEVTPL